MKWLKKIKDISCSCIAFIIEYAYAAIVLITTITTSKENFMMILLFFMFCVVLVLAVLSVSSCQYEYIAHIITVPEVTK